MKLETLQTIVAASESETVASRSDGTLPFGLTPEDLKSQVESAGFSQSWKRFRLVDPRLNSLSNCKVRPTFAIDIFPLPWKLASSNAPSPKNPRAGSRITVLPKKAAPSSPKHLFQSQFQLLSLSEFQLLPHQCLPNP